ncbi:MAG: hypothetical protein LBR25_06825 [Erysipelotrichaceae bacterium]|jgi:hypothetical protein|nr:hypothetical protein [Erysipelotrichaceae bacterium]
MYRLRSTIKCPKNKQAEILSALQKLDITEVEVQEIEYGRFVSESRLFWDFVFPQMLEEKQPVVYISYEFDDTEAGRKASHRAEMNIGWIPQNVRYVEV